MTPFHRAEADAVAVAVAAMFAAFPAVGGPSDAGVAAKVEATIQRLSSFPAWAIIRACERISIHGYVKSTPDGYVTERHWPPSDPEIIEGVRTEEKVYRTAYDSAVALLSAKVAS